MAKLILISKELLYDEGNESLREAEVAQIRTAAAAGHFIALISGHPKPEWFSEVESEQIQFVECKLADRKSGAVISRLIAQNRDSLEHSEVIIIAAKNDDMLPAFNTQTVLLRADWLGTFTDRFATYGCIIESPEKIPIVADLLGDEEPWYFSASAQDFEVYSLTNAGTISENDAGMLRLVNRLRGCLKAGDKTNLEAFKIHFVSSLYATPVFENVDLWGFYPGSKSPTDENGVMAQFCRLARTTFKKRSKGPLFLRHSSASKRHEQRGGDRIDPSEQIASIHLNPEYSGKIRGKIVCVVDDYLTYGCSFGVAEALLKKAGARKVICVSLGKFGNQARLYQINLGDQDPFSPIVETVPVATTYLDGSTTRQAQLEFLKKFRKAGLG